MNIKIVQVLRLLGYAGGGTLSLIAGLLNSMTLIRERKIIRKSQQNSLLFGYIIADNILCIMSVSLQSLRGH
jgi:hypothetical protein